MFIVNYYDEGMKVFHKKENVQTELISYYVNHVLPNYIEDAGNGRMDNTVEGAYRDVYEDLNSILDHMEIPYIADVTEVEEFSD